MPQRKRRTRGPGALLALATLAVAAWTGATPPAAAAVTCTTVTRRNLQDPDGNIFGNRYRAPVAINAAGDVLFASRARYAFEKLYLARANGSMSVVAQTFAPAANGGLIAGAVPFRQLSLNEAGDLAFLSPTSRGRALFVRQGFAPVEVAASAGGVSPLDEVRYDGIPAASSINESDVVAFVANLRDGRHGIFRYDAVLNEDALVYLAGVATNEGRELCLFEELELSDTGSLAIFAESKVECDDELETSVPGLFLSPGGIATIVRQGDASPVPGAIYRRLLDRPQMNASDDILFRALLAGTSTAESLFLRNGATGVITRVLSDGDPLPTGGMIRAVHDAHLADDGSVVVLVETDDDARFAVFRYGDGAATLLLSSADGPPTDEFTPPNRFVSFEPFFGLSGDGSAIGLVTRVRDGVRPRSKSGVLRCTE
jgi:hypothetical protein